MGFSFLFLKSYPSWSHKTTFAKHGAQGKRMKFLKITTILTKLPKLLTGVSALD
jgi:hypothetical protein